jgi:hypothetical protein
MTPVTRARRLIIGFCQLKGRNAMTRFTALGLTIAAASGIVMLAANAPAQQRSLKEQLVGTWLVTSVETTNSDGSKLLPFGAAPKGMTVFDATGHYIVFNISANLPKYASNNRMSGTADENKSVTQGSLVTYGTYTVDEATRTIVQHVDASSFPNWTGQEQKRPINKLTADELVYTNPAPTTGAGSTILTFRRAK